MRKSPKNADYPVRNKNNWKKCIADSSHSCDSCESCHPNCTNGNQPTLLLDSCRVHTSGVEYVYTVFVLNVYVKAKSITIVVDRTFAFLVSHFDRIFKFSTSTTKMHFVMFIVYAHTLST